MPIVSNPTLIFYACIAKGTTILAEFNGEQSPDLSPFAKKCIELTPPHHSMFSHTQRHKTYLFLVDDPFVYFAIFHDSLGKSEGLRFLNGVKLGFCELIKGGAIRNFNHLGLQAQFDFILRGLLSDSESLTSPGSVVSSDSRNPSLDSTNGVFSAPLLSSPGKGLKKKKRFFGETANGDCGKDGNFENKVDVGDEMNGYVPQNSPFSSDRQKAKQVWKKQVWVVLLLDLFVCVILFGVWLWVCRGFQCIDG